MSLKKSTTDVKGFLFSETSVTVYSAILATPIVLSFASRFQFTKIPTAIFLVVLGFIAFLISSQLRGYSKAVVQGIAIGIFLNALFSTKFGATLSARLSHLSVSG